MLTLDNTILERLEEIVGALDGDIRPEHNDVKVCVHEQIPALTMQARDLKGLLLRKKFPRIDGLSLIPNFGFSWKRYYEYLIYLEGWGEWPIDKPLRFRLNHTLIEVGKATAAFALLLEPIYYEKHIGQEEFMEFSTIRLIHADKTEVYSLLQEALYYLNSDYLKHIQGVAVLKRLYTDSDIVYGPPRNRSLLLTRSRVRTRARHRAVAPLALFNDAASNWGEQRFLGFYRVLEYFFHRSVLDQVARARYNQSMTEEEIVELARTQRELPQLINLINTLLTNSEKNTLIGFTTRRKVITIPKISTLEEALYQFRNGLVHAKEAEIRRAQLPDPFAESTLIETWNQVAETLAASAIKRLNQSTAER